MEKRNIIIIGIVVVIAAIAVGVAMFTSNHGTGPVTSFDTEFMSGAFTGNAVKSNETNQSYMASFEDKDNKITYNLTTMDDSESLMKIYKFQGVKGPDERTYNGNKWNIYYGEAMPMVNNSTNQTSNQSMGIVICECQKEKQGYVINIIFNDLEKVNFTLNTFGESYTKYVEPLLKSVSLKESKDVPAISEQFGLSKDEFNKQLDLIHQLEAGNYSGS